MEIAGFSAGRRFGILDVNSQNSTCFKHVKILCDRTKKVSFLLTICNFENEQWVACALEVKLSVGGLLGIILLVFAVGMAKGIDFLA